MNKFYEKKRNYPGETQFAKELEREAPIHGCKLIDIPDVVVTAEKLDQFEETGKFNERRRPFDKLLVSLSGNYCIELKYENRPLKSHQRKTQIKINKINRSYFVVRKKVKIDKVSRKVIPRYSIEQIINGQKIIYRFDYMKEIFGFFNSLRIFIDVNVK